MVGTPRHSPDWKRSGMGPVAGSIPSASSSSTNDPAEAAEVSRHTKDRRREAVWHCQPQPSTRRTGCHSGRSANRSGDGCPCVPDFVVGPPLSLTPGNRLRVTRAGRLLQSGRARSRGPRCSLRRMSNPLTRAYGPPSAKAGTPCHAEGDLPSCRRRQLGK